MSAFRRLEMAEERTFKSRGELAATADLKKFFGLA